LFRFHDSPFAGHLGVKKTLSRIRNRYFWPNMNIFGFTILFSNM
jgi:hypothetical protein